MARKDGMGGSMPKGSGTDNPNIGTKGNLSGAGSGRQKTVPFLPPVSEYGGSGANKNATGEVSKTTTPAKKFPFMPPKPE